MIGRTPADNNTLNGEVVAPLKYLSDFRRFLDLSLINCETDFDLSWPKKCITSAMSITPEVCRENPVTAIESTGAIFQINNDKLYVPVVNL